jgi:hypothetical protein
LILVTPHIVQPLSPDALPAGPMFPKSFLGPAKPDPDTIPKSK